MNVIGFINTNGYFPSPLATIAETSDSKNIISYPNGELVEVTISSEDKEHIISTNQKLKIDLHKYAYGISENNILFGTHREIISKLESLVKKSNPNALEIKIISKFIESTRNISASNIPNSTFQNITLDAIKDNYSLTILFTTRIIKHSRSSTARRLILQFIKNNSIRTAYRKNMSFDDSSTNITIPKSMVRPFLMAVN